MNRRQYAQSRSRTLVTVVALVAVAAVLAVGGSVIVNSIAASRLEASISQAVRPSTEGLPAPAVTIGGYELFTRSPNNSFPSVSIRVEGVDRPEVGRATVLATAEQVVIPLRVPEPSLLEVSRTRVSVLITGELLGRALGLEQVLLGNERDSSLAGGTEYRARITGMVPESGARISALVDLRIGPAGAQLVPVSDATDTTGAAKDVAQARTAWTLPPTLLPLDATITSLTVRGGTIVAEGSSPGPYLELRKLATGATPRHHA